MAWEICHVNRRLVPVKASYFFVLGAVASLFPYVAVYMRQLGLAPMEVAIIYGAMPFLDALVRPLIGAVADKLQAHKLVLMASCIGTGISMAGLLFVPGIPTNDLGLTLNAKVVCDQRTSVLEYCSHSHPCGNGDQLNGTYLSRDPLASLADCMIQCDIPVTDGEQSGLCFTPLDLSALPCTQDTWKHGQVLSDLEFVMEFNLTRTPHHGLSSVSCPSGCYAYAITSFTHNATAYQGLYCTQPQTLQCDLNCTHLFNNSTNPPEPYMPSHKKFGRTFWIFFMIFLLGNIFFSPIFSMIDAMTYAYLGDERSKWGEQRMWGTIGFAAAGFIAGLSMDLYSSGEATVNYIFIFVGYAALNFCAAVAVCMYDISSHVSASQVMSNLRSLLSNIEVASLLVVVFVCGMLVGVKETFLFWHLQTLGASQLLLGLCMMLNCLPEIPMLFLAGRIMKALGMVGCLYLVCVAQTVRYLAYSFLTDPWWVLCIEPLQAICFGLMYATASAYGSLVTPPGMHGTIQGLIAGFHFGFGKGVGSVAGGQVYEVYGAVVTFRCCSGLAALLLLFYVMVQCLVRQGKSPEKPEGEEKDDLQPDGVKATPEVIQCSPRLNGSAADSSHKHPEEGVTEPLTTEHKDHKAQEPLTLTV